MKTMRFYLVFVTLLFFSAVYSYTARAQEKEYFIGAPSVKGGAAAGKSISHWQSMFDKLQAEIEKELKVHIGLKFVANNRVLYNELKKGNVHLAIFGPMEYIIAKKEGVPIKPYLALTMKGAQGGGICLYVHKDSGIKSIKDLKGKKLGIWKAPALPPKGESWLTKGSDPSGLEDWIFARLAITKAGFNQPVNSFFGQVTVTPSQESGLYVLVNKKFDAVVAKKYTWAAMEADNKQMDALKPLTCEGGLEQPFVVAQNVDPGLLKKFKNLIMNLSKNPTLEKEWKSQGIAKVFEMKDDKDSNYDIYRSWLKQAETKGWLDEFRQVQQK